MGWNIHPFQYFRRPSLAALALMLVGSAAQAQYTTITDNDLALLLGTDAATGGSIAIQAIPTAQYGPNQSLLFGAPIRPMAGRVFGSHVYVRVDGGIAAGGDDYIFGDNDPAVTTEGGLWVTPPYQFNNSLRAVWGTKTISLFNPEIVITFTGTLMSDVARLQFDVMNQDVRNHTVALAFVQDFNANFAGQMGSNPALDAPLRLYNAPSLRTETLLSAGQVPRYWEAYATVPGGALGDPMFLHSVRGTLKPANSSSAEPTPPVRFAYGPTSVLNGSYNAAAPLLRYLNVWSFQPVPTDFLSGPNAITNSTSVASYYGETLLSPSQTKSVITYVGHANSDTDFTPPAALSVTSNGSLEYISGSNSLNVFTVKATVENLTDVVDPATLGSTITGLSLKITLPIGLKLSGTAATLPINSLPPGAAGAVSWNVAVDPTAANFQPGPYTYSVALTYPSTANGAATATKTVQRTIEIPAPLNFTLIGEHGVTNQYRMISFPFSSKGATPSQVFRLSGLNVNLSPNNFDIRQFNPTANRYDPVTSIVPGVGYWFRLNTNADSTISVDPSKYPPLGLTPTTVSFNTGWNVIGDPYVYSIRFSEIMVRNTQTGRVLSIQDAASPQYQWILPSIYRLDTSDANQNNWHYVQPDNFGFMMKPFEGYWIYFRQDKLQLVYPAPDTPLGQIIP